MDLTLTRSAIAKDGVLGTLKSNDLSFSCVTLEHAYEDITSANRFNPKLPAGTYKCVRGQHRLHNMTSDFTTFEITGVPGHSNILFHWGNYNRDSEGCVLIGDAVTTDSDGEVMITSSRLTFSEFMQFQNEVNEFILTVI